MAEQRRRSRRPNDDDAEGAAPAPDTGPVGEPELIVIARPEAGLRLAPGRAPMSLAAADVSPLADLLASENISMAPLFGGSEERVRAATAALSAETGAAMPDLSVYYRVEAPEERLDELAERLQGLPAVVAAYVKPPAEPPQRLLNDMAPRAEVAPPVTPDFTARQAYLDPAPGGIDARYAWTQTGGSGANVRIIDIEGAWRFSHEDLLGNQGGVAGGTESTDIGWRNHGTAVVGEFGGDRNAVGITGICPDANVRAVSIFGPGMGSAQAIRRAADMLGPGDIILIELHRPGPRFNFAGRNDQRGYIAVEWWPDDFDAIRYAIGKGVIVVEAAGNGAENLDDPLYNAPGPGFPPGWSNPFNRANRDSGAIVVGAGAPPPGTHGRDHGPDRSRLDFSNFGALVDAQGWGREVTTAAYGDLQGGAGEDEWYTDQFSGTSSASPIVVGALGCVQGVLRAAGATPLSPAGARDLLRATGSPQQDAPGRPATQRIGNRPDLRQAIARARPDDKKTEVKDIVKEGKREKLEKIEKEKREKNEKLEKEKREKSEKLEKEKREKSEKREKDKTEKIEKREKVEKREKPEKLEKNEKREKLEKAEKNEKLEKPEAKELKDAREVPPLGFGAEFGAAPYGAEDVEQRLAALEERVAQLSHFIGAELRPDLSGGALTYETDYGAQEAAALSEQLAKEAADAKQAKDNKDIEKMNEG